ncbi:MAG: hypothetical protein NTV93_16750 [Verrucomicrobia bacterium]|nr:hypothetical protein [Verrucomicrobiota bacterium]
MISPLPWTLLIAFATCLPVSALTVTDLAGREVSVVSVEGGTVSAGSAGGLVVQIPLAKFSAEVQRQLKDWKLDPSDNAAALEQTALQAATPPPMESRFVLEFPELGPTRSDVPTTSTVTLPTGYDPAKTYPMAVWLGGGNGGDGGAGFPLPDWEWVYVGLPYPKGANNKGQDTMVGDFKAFHKYYGTILAAVHKRVPNIDKSRSLIGGFSNGAHAIDGLLSIKTKDFSLADEFAIFVLADGGGHESVKGSYPPMKGKFAYLCYGEKSPNARITPKSAKSFKARGAVTVLSEMKGAGHDFPAEEQAKVREWLENTVLPAWNAAEAK